MKILIGEVVLVSMQIQIPIQEVVLSTEIVVEKIPIQEVVLMKILIGEVVLVVMQTQIPIQEVALVTKQKMIDICENLGIQKHKLKYNIINDQLMNSQNPIFNLIIFFRDLYEPYLTMHNIQKITPTSLRINKAKKT